MSITSLSLNETCLKEGSAASLRCNVRGFPRPRIEFQQDGIEIIPGAELHNNILMEFYDQAGPQCQAKDVCKEEGWEGQGIKYINELCSLN